MQRRSFILAALALPFVEHLARAQSLAESVIEAFKPGEKLKYSLGWQFVVAGHATLEVLPDEEVDGRKVRNFKMTAQTSKVVDAIYKVRDTMTSRTEYDVSRSLGFQKKQREGDTKRDETIEFDWDKMEAHYMDAARKKDERIAIPDKTQDPLSAFYFIRTQKFDVGSVFQGPLTDGKKCKVAEIRVVKREKIKVNGKKYDTFKLVPDIKDIGGVFKKSDDASIEIWCTADERHIPVLLKSKVAVGSFRAELES